MGNPLRKENLGGGMTGGHGALPYFNAFMNPFMKDKPRETFPDAPPMPADVKRQSELRKREELEKLEEADAAGRRTGIVFTPGTKVDPNAPLPGGDTTETTKPVDTQPVKTDPDPVPDKPVVIRPPVSQPAPRTEVPADKPEGTKRKGKKGDG
jgi:membrane carboxypeptidase/penicillin-binding protein